MKNDKFDTFASIMSAVVLILGALAACLAVFAASSASDADSDGTVAASNLQETTISSNITAYEHFQAYVIYRRNDALVNLLWEATDTADSENAQAIERKIREIGGLSGELRHNFFPPGYILNERDVVAESYNVHREIAEARAEAARTQDLDSQVHFQRADTLRLRSLLLTADLIVFAMAFWFFTVAQALENKIKYLFAIGGVLMAFSGLVLILGAEVLL